MNLLLAKGRVISAEAHRILLGVRGNEALGLGFSMYIFGDPLDHQGIADIPMAMLKQHSSGSFIICLIFRVLRAVHYTPNQIASSKCLGIFTMNKKISEKLIEILRAELNGTDEADLTNLTDEELDAIYNLSCKHNVFTMVGDYMYKHGIERNQILWDMANAQEKIEMMDKALAEVSNALNEAHISFLILKGPEMRKLYPKPWMRLSGDIDILIHEKDKLAITNKLCNTLSYTFSPYEYEDHFMSPKGVIFDISTALHGPSTFDLNKTLYNEIWKFSSRKSNKSFQFILSDEMQYTHTVIHIAKHLRNGGCGINHIMDLWVLNHRSPVNNQILERRSAQVKKMHINKAEENLVILSEKWFSGTSVITVPNLEEFILDGSAHGSIKNKIIFRMNNDCLLTYCLKRLFVPYDHLCSLFPQLSEKEWLVPFYEIYRWIYYVRKGRLSLAVQEIQEIKRYNKNNLNAIYKMFEALGI